MTRLAMYLQINRDRHLGLVKQKEKELLVMLGNSERNGSVEAGKVFSILKDLQFVRAANIIIRLAEVLKQRSQDVFNNSIDAGSLPEIASYISSIIWAVPRFEIPQISDIPSLFKDILNSTVSQEVAHGVGVDKELKDCFIHILPSTEEINQYWLHFAEKYQVSQQLISTSLCNHRNLSYNIDC